MLFIGEGRRQIVFAWLLLLVDAHAPCTIIRSTNGLSMRLTIMSR